MNKIKKRTITLALAVGIASFMPFAFAGCDKTEEQSKDPTENSSPVEQEPVTPQGPTEEQIKQEEEKRQQELSAAIEKVDAFAKQAQEGQNFSYSCNMQGSVKQIYVDGQDVKVVENGQEKIYTTSADGDKVVYTFNADKNKYQFQLSNQSASSIVLSALVAFSDEGNVWTEYDKDSQTLSGTNTFGNIAATLDEEQGNLTLTSQLGQEKLYAVDSTQVEIPQNALDETKKLFTIVDGQKQFNLTLLKTTLEDWFAETNFYTEKLKLNVFECSLDDIIYFYYNETKSQYEFAAFVTEEGDKEYQAFKLSQNFSDALANSLTTADELVTYLYDTYDDIGFYPIMISGAGIILETSLTQQDMLEMWPSIKNRLENYGPGLLGQEEGKVDKFKNAEIIDEYPSYCTGIDKVTSGDNLGIIQRFGIHYLVRDKYTGQEWDLSIGLSAQTDNGHTPFENVKQDIPRSWIIPGYSYKEVAIAPPENDKMTEQNKDVSARKIDLFLDDRQKQ